MKQAPLNLGTMINQTLLKLIEKTEGGQIQWAFFKGGAGITTFNTQLGEFNVKYMVPLHGGVQTLEISSKSQGTLVDIYSSNFGLLLDLYPVVLMNSGMFDSISKIYIELDNLP